MEGRKEGGRVSEWVGGWVDGCMDGEPGAPTWTGRPPARGGSEPSLAFNRVAATHEEVKQHDSG